MKINVKDLKRRIAIYNYFIWERVAAVSHRRLITL